MFWSMLFRVICHWLGTTPHQRFLNTCAPVRVPYPTPSMYTRYAWKWVILEAYMMLVNYGKLTCKSTSTMDDLGWRRHLSTNIRWCKGCSFLGWYWRGLIWGTHSEIYPSKLSPVISFDHTVHLSFPCHPMWRWWGAWRSGCPWRSLRSP